MKKLLGIILIILGIILGGYLALYLMLYGGICQVIYAINPINAKDIALGIIRIIFFEVGIIPGYILGIYGLKLMCF